MVRFRFMTQKKGLPRDSPFSIYSEPLLFLGFVVLGVFALVQFEQVVCQRVGHEDTGVGTERDTDEHSKDETADDFAAEDEDHQQGDQGGGGGVHVTTQRAVDGGVEVVVVGTLRIESHVLTYTVEDDHHVVDGVTDDRQDSGDEVLVDLHGERHDLV